MLNQHPAGFPMHATSCLHHPQPLGTLFSSRREAYGLVQVIRMLRVRPGDIGQVEAFQSMHKLAKQDNFGHMFRSPSLWEDMVKTITLCNCG